MKLKIITVKLFSLLLVGYITKNENYYNQKGELGDCMVGTKGTLFEELFLSWQVSEELKKDASMCFFYDMCRNEEKVHIY